MKQWFICITALYGILFVSLIAIVMLRWRAYKAQLEQDRLLDPETGIGNLLHFERSFDHIITDENRQLYYIAYIIIDSNYLQLYHGEAILKDAIKYTAGILNAYIEENEFTARITENGFAIAYRSKSESEAMKVVQGLMKQLNHYIDSTDAETKSYYYTALYSLQPQDTNSGYLLFNLRKNCNLIMDTGQQLLVCDASMIHSAAAEKQLLDRISKGFRNKEFKLYLQFVVDNHTKQIVSAEALSRWESPEGMVYPGSYIQALERAGQIDMLDYYMFEMCCQQLHKWRGTELGHLTISCNFTRLTLSEKDFVDRLTDIAKRYVFDNKKLIIEITEDTMEKDFACATENVRACKELGYKIALDDFGTGYTALSNICDYPIDIVKIDRNILLKTDTENGRRMFVGIVALAHSLELRVICEGVETEEQKKLVEETDCDMVQGWYYSKVFPYKEGEKFAKEKR